MSLWPITTTKTVEELSEPRSGAKQQYEALLKKHAIEYTMLMNEYDEMKRVKTEFETMEKDGEGSLRRCLPSCSRWRSEQVFTIVEKNHEEPSDEKSQSHGSTMKVDEREGEQNTSVEQTLGIQTSLEDLREEEEQPFPDC